MGSCWPMRPPDRAKSTILAMTSFTGEGWRMLVPMVALGRRPSPRWGRWWGFVIVEVCSSMMMVLYHWGLETRLSENAAIWLEGPLGAGG